MRLEPLYTIRFFYPQGWSIGLVGKKALKKITSILLREHVRAELPASSEDQIILIVEPMRRST